MKDAGRVNVRLTPGQLAALDRLVEEYGLSRSEILRVCLAVIAGPAILSSPEVDAHSAMLKHRPRD